MGTITLFSNEKRKNYYFSNINLLLGYSGSGKTMVLDDLEAIFNGKRKNFLLNGIPIKANDFNLFKVGSFEDLGSHLKMNAKSLVKRYILSLDFPPEFIEECNKTSEALQTLVDTISSSIQSILPKSKLTLGYDNLLELILDSASLSTEEDSHSYFKKSMFRIFKELSLRSEKKTIVLMDDFDTSMDEGSVLDLFSYMKEIDAYFFVTSSKPLPQQVLDQDVTIYAVRNGNMIPFPNIRGLLTSSLERQPMYQSFEEYMLSKGYLETSGILECYIKKIQEDQCANLMKILTTEDPLITYEPVLGRVCVIPKSEEEEKIYRSALEILSENRESRSDFS